MCVLCWGWRLKAEAIGFQSGRTKESPWPSSDAKDQIALKRQSVSGVEPSFNDALCLFFWERHSPLYPLPLLLLPSPHPISYFICGQPNRSLSPIPHLTPPPEVQSDCFKPGDLRGGNEGVKAFFCVFQKQVFVERKKKGIGIFFSQDLDTSNWDFMPYFLWDLKTCSTANSISPRTDVRETVVRFYFVFVALSALFYFFIYLFIYLSCRRGFLMKVHFLTVSERW